MRINIGTVVKVYSPTALKGTALRTTSTRFQLPLMSQIPTIPALARANAIGTPIRRATSSTIKGMAISNFCLLNPGMYHVQSVDKSSLNRADSPVFTCRKSNNIRKSMKSSPKGINADAGHNGELIELKVSLDT